MSEKLKIYLLISSILLALRPNIYPQDQAKVDSLDNLLQSAGGRERFEILGALSAEIVRSDNARSLELADEAISLARDLNNIELEIEGYIYKGYAYEAVYNDNEALQTYQKALEVSDQNNFDKGRAKSLYRIGKAYSNMRDFSRSDEYLNNALEISKAIKDLKTQGEVMFIQADNMRVTGNFEGALKRFNEALEVARKTEDLNTMAGVYGNIGLVYYAQGNFNEAINNYEESRKLRIEQGNRLMAARIDNRIANAYYNLAKYDLAIEHYQKALPVFEQYKENQGVAAVYNGMAVIYFVQKFYDKALENHIKKLAISREMGDQREVGNTLNNLGTVYSEIATDSLLNIFGDGFQDSVLKEKSDKYFFMFAQALDYYNQALAIREQLNDRSGLAKTLNNIGTSYMRAGKLDLARDYYERSLTISEKTNDANELALSLSRLGQIYNYKGDYERAQNYLNQGLQYALEMDLKEITKDIYLNLSEVYAKSTNFPKALEYYKLHSAVKDSISNKETRDMISEMQVKYETDVLMKDNQLLITQSELSQSKVRQQRTIIYFFIFGLFSISTLVVLLVRQNNQRKKANQELAQKNALITEQKKEITDSIQYASRIQSALLPPGDYIDQLIPERFIIYFPRDIVSGDYYWITEKNGKVICVTADCTGHGVPGAFMSMLGIAFLNEILSKQDEFHTDDILNTLRSNVIDSLHQTGKEGESQDGMDIALYILDLEQMKLEYSGANLSLYLLRNGDLMELKSDKMPIGIHVKANIPFTRHNIDIQKNDMLYTHTDGYPDQFGGPFQKKFMVKNFKNILSEIHSWPIEEQKKKLVDVFNDWKSGFAQVDDVLVVGVRI
jgi:tetratricopeptide (TPR) repeat protein/serine phosphatase RsbU (regulator of sigma subunit)